MKFRHLLALAVPAVVLAGGIASAGIPDARGTIHACRAGQDGTLRVVDREAGAACASGESALDWSRFNGTPAGGALTGVYPNPSIANGVIKPSMLSPGAFPAVDAWAFNDSAIPGNGTFATLPLPMERFDTQGMHDTALNTERLVAPVTGMYQINAEVRWSGGTMTNSAYHAMRVRGIGPRLNGWFAEDQAAQIQNWRVGNVQNASALVQLNAGDRVHIEVLHTVANPQGARGHLTMHLVQPTNGY